MNNSNHFAQISSLQMPLGQTLRIDFQNRIPFKNELPRLNPPLPLSANSTDCMALWAYPLLPESLRVFPPPAAEIFYWSSIIAKRLFTRNSVHIFYIHILHTYWLQQIYSNILLFWHRLGRIYDLRSLASTETLSRIY